ncbi:MAG TPA: DUF393 domain-containing protein [Geobacteraceae bacterium]|nr:DUF393 domain-containing protein [Geobacteraceae bacterium]
MPGSPIFPLKVFYDGSCSVCATEIEHYAKKDHEGRLELVDISAPDFTPDRYSISLVEFMYQLHAIDRDGKVYRGPVAFWAIWQAFPTSTWYGMLGAFITLPGVSFLARLGYRGFARIRKYLPKRNVAVCKIGKER